MPTRAPANNADEDGADEGDIRRQEVVDPATHQHAQCDGGTHDQDDLKFLGEVAFFAKQQHPKAPRSYQHATDRRSHAQADQ